MKSKKIRESLIQDDQPSNDSNHTRSLVAAVLLHAEIQKRGLDFYDLLSDSGTPALEIAKRAARHLVEYDNDSRVPVHAYQLFEPGKSLSVEKIAARFADARWHGLTSKPTVLDFLKSLTRELWEEITRIPKRRVGALRMEGESKLSARELSRFREQTKERLAATKSGESHIPHDLFLLAAELGIREDRLRQAVPRHSVLQLLPSKNAYGIYAGDPFPTGVQLERSAISVALEIHHLKRELHELKQATAQKGKVHVSNKF